MRGFGFCTRVAAVHLRPANLVLCRREVAAKVTSKPRCINGTTTEKAPPERVSDDVHRGWACRSSPRAFLPPRRRSPTHRRTLSPDPGYGIGGLFALGLWPLDHVDMSAVGALKQQDRGEPVVEPGQLPGELHARPATTDQPRLWPVVHV